MPSVVLAWLVGEGIIFYRSYKNDHRPPMPGQLLASTGLFAVLGVVARNPQGSFLAGAMAWGFDIAAFMNIAPSLLTGATKQPAAAEGSGGKLTPPKGGAKQA